MLQVRIPPTSELQCIFSSPLSSFLLLPQVEMQEACGIERANTRDVRFACVWSSSARYLSMHVAMKRPWCCGFRTQRATRKARGFVIGEHVRVAAGWRCPGYCAGDSGTVILLLPPPRWGRLPLCHVQMD